MLFLYRDSYYNPDSDAQGICEVNVAKQRNGPTGVVELAWLAEFARFRSLQPASGDPSGDAPRAGRELFRP